MASASEKAEYEQDRLDTVEDLKESGFEAGFGSSPVVNRRKTDYAEICKEYCLLIESADEFKSVIKSGQRVFMVSNQAYLIESCKQMILDGVPREIVDVKKTSLDNEIILFYFILVEK